MLHRSNGRCAPRPGARWILSLFALMLCAVTSGAWAQTPGCQVTYTKSWEGGGGFGADLLIRNTGPAITSGWTLTFSFPNGQRVTNGWPVTFTQPAGSAQVTVASNAAWNQAIATNGTISAGFNGTYTTTNTAPSSFTLNG